MHKNSETWQKGIKQVWKCLEKINVSRIDFKKSFQRLSEIASALKSQELIMARSHIDSEFPFCDEVILHETEKLRSEEN